MELKMLDKIQAHVKALVRLVDKEYNCRLGLDFGAIDELDMVEYAILQSDFCAQAFATNFVNKCQPAASLSIFTMSLLHELGHLETSNEMRDDTQQRDKVHDLFSRDQKKGMEKYLKLHNEVIATEWAYSWFLENLAIVRAWDKSLTEIMKKFCKVNKITLDE